MPSFEQIFDRDEPLQLFIIARHPRVCTTALGAVLAVGGVLLYRSKKST